MNEGTVATCKMPAFMAFGADFKRRLNKKECPSRTCSGNASNVHLGMAWGSLLKKHEIVARAIESHLQGVPFARGPWLGRV